MVHKADTAVAWGWSDATGSVALDKPNWAGWQTPIYMWTAIPNDIFLVGNTGGIAGAYGGTIGTVGFWNTTESWAFATIQSSAVGSLTSHVGTGTALSTWADYHAQTWAARWDVGNSFQLGGTAPARRVFETLGQSTGTNNYGQDSVSVFFDPANGAADLGAKQILRNELRWLFNPDAVPAPNILYVKSTSPAAGTTADVLGTVTVIFSEPVYGILPNDLTWNASTSGVTYHATTAAPLGNPAPNDTWVFDGAWETDAAIRAVMPQSINISLNGLDGTISQSHIKAVNGDGLPVTNWTWTYLWNPPAAAVPNKLWTMYE
jgi:hypothetical protein